jgi:hypothetical protein
MSGGSIWGGPKIILQTNRGRISENQGAASLRKRGTFQNMIGTIISVAKPLKPRIVTIISVAKPLKYLSVSSENRVSAAHVLQSSSRQQSFTPGSNSACSIHYPSISTIRHRRTEKQNFSQFQVILNSLCETVKGG